MIETKQYNKVSEAIRPRPLKKDEVAVYVSAGNIIKNGIPMHPTNILYAVTDVITDPEKGSVEIAYVLSDAPEGKLPRIGNVEFNSEDKGVISIMGSVPSQRHLYDFLELTNFNGSNPNRDKTRPIYFYRKDVGFDTNQKLEKARLEREATNYALDTPIGEIKEALAVRNVNVNQMDEQTLRARALEEGKKKPFLVVKDAVETSAEFDKIIGECFETAVIKFDPSKKCLVNTETYSEYPLDGLVQTTNKEKKQQMFLAACKSDQEFYQKVYDDVKVWMKNEPA